jgi:hypothetical protein
VVEEWSSERVRALAPDPASAAAGAALATPAQWSQAGSDPAGPALWGLYQGSGKKPYQTVVDLAGPAFACSCPSRKFPCKHALGLMYLWLQGGVPAGPPPGFAADWLAGRAGRAGRAAASVAVADSPSADGAGKLPDPVAAAKRVADRASRVQAGLEELDQWLCDQIRTGLSGQERFGYQQLDGIAARMVDAQAPGVAARLRSLTGVLASGEGWHARLLAEYALLRMLVRAHQRLDQLPSPLVAAVRGHVGYPIARADVLSRPAVRDTWAVLGRRDSVENRLTVRRVWLQGAQTGRPAVVLSFAAGGSGAGPELDGSLIPGTGVEADLHFYPSGIRALVGDRKDEPELLPRLQGTSVAGALAGYSKALAGDPWISTWPVLLAAVAPVRSGKRWLVREPSTAALPLVRSAGDPWSLLALSGGRPVTLAGEWSPEGLAPLSVVRGTEVVPL